MESKNKLESSVYQLKNQLSDEEKLGGGQISEDDMEILMSACNDVIEWLDENVNGDKDDYIEKQQEFDDIVQPILQNAHGAQNEYQEQQNYYDHEDL